MQSLPTSLYHYTSASSLPNIIQKKDGTTKLYATHSNYLNDNDELNTGVKMIVEVLKESPAILNLPEERLSYLDLYFSEKNKFSEKNEVSKSEGFYLTCFSEATGIVDQWRGYGNSGYGFALGYVPGKLLAFSENHENVHFLKCIYEEKTQVEAIIEAAVSAQANYGFMSTDLSLDKQDFLAKAVDNIYFARSIEEASLRIKHKAFSQEREWRLVVNHRVDEKMFRPHTRYAPGLEFRSSKLGLVPHITISLPQLNSVVVGPSPDQQANVDAIEMLLLTRMPTADLKLNVSVGPTTGWVPTASPRA